MKERLEIQAEQYRKVFAVFREYRDVVTSVTIWVWDAGPGRITSRCGEEDRTMFDLDYKPKEAFGKWSTSQSQSSRHKGS